MIMTFLGSLLGCLYRLLLLHIFFRSRCSPSKSVVDIRKCNMLWFAWRIRFPPNICVIQ
uniref:Uncharacterized protein n=1 Tax=Arundo donax TaxID=35708 RepID=A0A0A9FL27_ARUDO